LLLLPHNFTHEKRCAKTELRQDVRESRATKLLIHAIMGRSRLENWPTLRQCFQPRVIIPMKDESRRLNIMLEQNPIETAIAAIVVDKKLHARWLNTFSYLEYIGFRKIVKSQMAEALTNKVISHALEEGR
jgi:hypothetical protein